MGSYPMDDLRSYSPGGDVRQGVRLRAKTTSHGLCDCLCDCFGKNGRGKYRNIVYIRYILLIIFYTQKQLHKHTGGYPYNKSSPCDVGDIGDVV